jgi:hypothetical protein
MYLGNTLIAVRTAEMVLHISWHLCSRLNYTSLVHAQYLCVWTLCCSYCLLVECSWNVMARGDAQEGKWRGNWQMEWVASTLQTTSEHGVSSITTADAHTSAASKWPNWRPCRFKWKSQDKIWFLRVCHHISNAVCLCLLLLYTTDFYHSVC